ncbi:glutathione peroxidase [Algibacillus agarilyticus]|uniref:glutathione peroxidase n=1 Tax=Algibacillus agarilyticus TaxID=2234133 RepID=UPI000DD000EB|nr:glutathione peroxidase [Algibacillus agarilyticus]
MSVFYSFKVSLNNGEQLALESLKDKVVLVVNTASKCGFTPQYEELETLYQKHKAQGLEILAFPCNQFGKQEPANNTDIQSFCSLNYHVSFPVLAKIEVNGKNADPLYQYLTKAKKGLLGTKRIKWNFTKFLINQEGQVVGRFSPTVKPLDLEQQIIKLLKK